jgi:translation initiation factor RLI1
MTKQNSVPWWTEELTIKRKRRNALRRRYQRTKNNEELREYRKNTSHEKYTKYQATIKQGKIKIVGRILQLDTMHKSMERSLQANIKQNKEQPKVDSLAKTRWLTHVWSERNCEGHDRLSNSQRRTT